MSDAERVMFDQLLDQYADAWAGEDRQAQEIARENLRHQFGFHLDRERAAEVRAKNVMLRLHEVIRLASEAT